MSFDPAKVRRPDPLLLRYYLITACIASFCIIPLTLLIFIPLYLRYRSLRYDFDDEGVRMKVGILFQREVNLTFRRIQDIHVSRGIIQRWLGLASVSVQTASGSATPEMTIEGVREPDVLRDYLYQMMRGAKGDEPAAKTIHSAEAHVPEGDPAALLQNIAEELRAIRNALEARGEGR